MSNESKALTERQLQALRNMGCEFEQAADEIESLRAQLAALARPVQHEIIKIAAECARREPIAAMYELTEATHIGHRQFSRAFDLVDAAIVRLSARLKSVADSLSAAPSQQAPVAQEVARRITLRNFGGEKGRWQQVNEAMPGMSEPLYTHQQQPSEPMTADQIKEEWFEICSLNVPSLNKALMLARAVERHHNIKGKQ